MSANVAETTIAPELRKQLRAEWVKALRSGEYKQGRGSLNNRGDFCCLGVACEVAVKCGVQMTVVSEGPETAYDGEGGIAPTALVEAMGLRDHHGTLRGAKLCDFEYLTRANDRGVSFAEIADFIEAHPEAIYVD